jgi:hypothetical protein
MAGVDDDLDQNLESFADLDYPAFEILFGVADRADPAYAAARAFAQRHPSLDVKVVVTRPGQVPNPKVSQLIDLEPLATGDVILLSDSNVRVAPDHLWSVVRGFADPRVGMVMTAFVGTGERTLGAALENLQICATTTPGLVAVNCWSPRPLAVGKAMGIRRADLAALGGFASVGDVLAEDHVLARRFLDAGRRIATSLDAVENRNTSCSLARTIERHTRGQASPVGVAAGVRPRAHHDAGHRREHRAGSVAVQGDGSGAGNRLHPPDAGRHARGANRPRALVALVVCSAGSGEKLRPLRLLAVRVREPSHRLARSPLHSAAGKRYRPAPH